MSEVTTTFKAQVLAALEVSCLAYGRAVSASEVRRAFEETNEHPDAVRKAAKVSKELNRVYKRGEVQSPGLQGRIRFYAPQDGRNWGLPEVKSRRQHTLDLVRAVCRQLGVAVRMGDIRSAAEVEGLDADMVARDVANLTRTGQLVVVGTIVGDGTGDNLYCPPELEDAVEIPARPLTWLEEVDAVCARLWAERVERARELGTRPIPFSTGDVRTVMRRESPDHPQLKDPQLLVNALRSLASREAPRLRALRRPGASRLLWVPAGVTDQDVDLPSAFASDAGRVIEAVRRAETRAMEPVSMSQVEAELDLDPSLAPRKADFKSVLHDSVRTRLAGGSGERVDRKNQAVSRIGKLSGTVLYTTQAPERGERWLRFARVRDRVDERRYQTEFQRIASVPLRSVALGRLRLLHRRLETAIHDVEAFGRNEGESSRWRVDVEAMEAKLSGLRREVERALEREAKAFPDLPEVPVQERIGWTAAEVIHRFGSLYEAAEKIEGDTELVAYLAPLVHRIRNPRHRRRSHPEAEQAAEFLFDPTSMMAFAARHWGGLELRNVSSLTESTLGGLRDPTFLVPALGSDDLNDRLTAVACLSFLPAREAGRLLREVAFRDDDPHVREAAAYGLALGVSADHREVLRRISAEDPEPECRGRAARLSELDYEGVLKV